MSIKYTGRFLVFSWLFAAKILTFINFDGSYSSIIVLIILVTDVIDLCAV